jgi:hypothetical protein
VSTYVHTKLSNNLAFDIIRPAKGNSLDVVQLSKSSVLIISDEEVDMSCVLLLEKIVRQLTGDVRVIAPAGKSRRRIQFPVRVREPDKSAFRDQGPADRLRAPRIYEIMDQRPTTSAGIA